ncbi:hypothetical protein LINPERHAP2_LOCUS44890 [Linum perenne]
MDSLEFQDWEFLAHSDLDAVSSPPVSTDNPRNLEEIEADSGGMIRFDYFSLGNDKAVIASGDVESSVDSNNPSWIDPATDSRFESKNPCGFWSDSGSDRSSDGLKASDFDVRTELVGADQETEVKEKDLSKLCSDSDAGNDSDSSSIVEAVDCEEEEEEKKKQVVAWWKVPLELLKFCVFRVSPVWTFSMAAAVMGFVILGRRLYNMKRKAKSLQLKVIVDDKKVSQFMSRAARLNEAFSVARRVPIVRPMLPASGVNPWPVMSIR